MVELHIALLAPDVSAPVTWDGAEQGPGSVERLRRQIAPGPVPPLLRSRAVRLLPGRLERGRSTAR